MQKSSPPPRPNDLFGAMLWDSFYGPGSEGNPLRVVSQQIDGLKQDLKSTLTISKSMDQMNETIKETNSLMRETNNTLKTLAERLK